MLYFASHEFNRHNYFSIFLFKVSKSYPVDLFICITCWIFNIIVSQIDRGQIFRFTSVSTYVRQAEKSRSFGFKSSITLRTLYTFADVHNRSDKLFGEFYWTGKRWAPSKVRKCLRSPERTFVTDVGDTSNAVSFSRLTKSPYDRFSLHLVHEDERFLAIEIKRAQDILDRWTRKRSLLC